MPEMTPRRVTPSSRAASKTWMAGTRPLLGVGWFNMTRNYHCAANRRLSHVARFIAHWMQRGFPNDETVQTRSDGDQTARARVWWLFFIGHDYRRGLPGAVHVSRKPQQRHR